MILSLLIFTAYLIVSIAIKYPVSAWQVNWGIGVWPQRALALLFLLWGLRKLQKNISQIAYYLIIISPSIWGLWLSRPKETLVLAIMWRIMTSRNRYKIFLIIGLVLFSIKVSDAPLIGAMKINKAQAEVVGRFTAESRLSDRVIVPLWFERLGNNKLAVLGKNIWKETTAVVDLESIFFQEFHPLSRKSLPIFFWPTICLLPLGLTAVFKSKNKKIIPWLMVGVVYFWLKNDDYFVRYSWLLVGLAIILGQGWEKIKKLNLKIAWILVFLIAYGLQAFWFDVSKMVDFWLDNRPIAYRWIFSHIKNTDNTAITTLIGDSRAFCRYYLKESCRQLSFGISQENNRPYQIGFLGEFIGADFNNIFPENFKENLAAKGLELSDSLKLRDSIAYKYSDYLVIVKRK